MSFLTLIYIAVSDDTYWQSKGIISTSWVSGIGDYTDILVPSSAANTAKKYFIVYQIFEAQIYLFFINLLNYF